MSVNSMNAALIKKMFLAGVSNLESNKEWINELNVFPVPDGDTGTNMTLTILSAAKEVMALPEDADMEALAKAISSGSLRGARGNSGVILSQLFRGFTKEMRQYSELSIETLACALQRATETAYKAVMKPKEGTILTVARGIAEKAAELAMTEEDMDSFLQALLEHGEQVLQQTPEMLPVLKQAGVVDSGGQGLMQVLKGAYEGYLGKEVSVSLEARPAETGTVGAGRVELETADIKFGYCTEFIILTEKSFTDQDERELKAYLESIGDSIVCVADEELVKIHVHTNDPGLAIQKALTYGQLSRMKIDNMREEHHERVIKDAEKLAAQQKQQKQEQPQPRKEYGFIAVSAGKGLGEIFQGLGVDCLIEGGQTMNPSTEDMLRAIEQVSADTIFIFPNNKNIILAAEQARQLVEDKKVYVIPSKTIPQGITAIISFTPEKSMEENYESMKEEITHVKTGNVTYAVRDTVIDNIEIHKDDIMGIGDSGILAEGRELLDVAYQTVKAMIDEESELIGIYYGEDVSQENAYELKERLEAEFPLVDIEINSGKQPIYYYILSVE